MECGDYIYTWQATDWPVWRIDLASLAQPLAEVSRAQGLLLGRLTGVGLTLRDQARLAALTDDVVRSSEIEGVTSMRSLCDRASPGGWVSISVRWPPSTAMQKVWSTWCWMPRQGSIRNSVCEG